MNAKFFLFVVALATAAMASAQKNKLTYQPLIQVGLLEGEGGSAFQLQTVQGVQLKTWSAGVGAGLDYYHTRSVPVFLDLRKAFPHKRQGAFVYADGGYNFPWLTTTDKQFFSGETKGGLFYDAGLGYEFPVSSSQRLFFSAGYSYKFQQQEFSNFYCPFIGPCYTDNSVMKYSLRRLSIKTGLRF